MFRNAERACADSGDRADRRDLARMLGMAPRTRYGQAENGKQALPAEKARWLSRYAKVRARHAASEAAWLEKNPPQPEKAP